MSTDKLPDCPVCGATTSIQWWVGDADIDSIDCAGKGAGGIGFHCLVMTPSEYIALCALVAKGREAIEREKTP